MSRPPLPLPPDDRLKIQSAEAALISEAHVNASPGPATVEPGVTTKASGSPISLADLREDGAEWIDQDTVDALVAVVEAAYVVWINLPSHAAGFSSLVEALERFVHPPSRKTKEAALRRELEKRGWDDSCT